MAIEKDGSVVFTCLCSKTISVKKENEFKSFKCPYCNALQQFVKEDDVVIEQIQ